MIICATMFSLMSLSFFLLYKANKQLDISSRHIHNLSQTVFKLVEKCGGNMHNMTREEEIDHSRPTRSVQSRVEGE